MTQPGVLLLASATLVVAVVAVWKSRRIRMPWDLRAAFDAALRSPDVRSGRSSSLLGSGWVVRGADARPAEDSLLTDLGREFEFQQLRIPDAGTLQGAIEQVRRGLVENVANGSDPWMLVAAGDGIPCVLQVLADEPVVRDRVWAVIALGASVRGGSSRWSEEQADDWYAANFRSSVLDTEMHRPTLYLALDTSSGTRVGFPDGLSEDGPSWIEVANVSVASAIDEQNASAVARAIATAVRGWCAARGG